MAKNFSMQSIVGKNNIPTPYIKKIELETHQANGLLVTLNLSLLDILNTKRKRFQWLKRDKIQKYLLIRIIESRNPELTRLLSSEGATTSVRLKALKKDYNFVERTISASGLIRVKDLQSESIRINEVNRLYMVPYEIKFRIPVNTPPHLAYFCYCHLDTRAITGEYGIKFKNKRFREVQSYVTGELVFDNGRSPTEASIYQLPNGDIWAGAVHFNDKSRKYMAGPIHTEKSHSILERTKISNFKVQDQRVMNSLQTLKLNLKGSTNVIDKITPRTSASWPSSEFGKKQNFISSAFISRDSDGKANLVFSIDLARILRENAQFGMIIKDADIFDEVSKYSRINSFKLFRTRVRKNMLTTNPCARHKRFNIDTKRELIVHNSEITAGRFENKMFRRYKEQTSKRNVILSVPAVGLPARPGIRLPPPPPSYDVDSIERSGVRERIGFVKEINLLNAETMRSFSCTDYSMTKVTDGIYQYSIELEIEDGTLEYVLDVLRRLKESKSMLLRYLNEARLLKNYDTASGKFSKRFIQKKEQEYPDLSDDEILNTPNLLRQKRNSITIADAPWNMGIAIFLDIINKITNMSDVDLGNITSSLHSMISPKTGTPEGISKFINVYENFEMKIRNLLFNRGVGDTEFDVNIKTSSGPFNKDRFKKSLIIVEKKFGDVFDSDVIKRVEYDFLGGRKANRRGMREIAASSYIERAGIEHSKYFIGEPTPSTNAIRDLRQTDGTYLSPARVKYGLGTLKILNSTGGTWTISPSLWEETRYNDATLTLAMMKSDTTRDDLSASPPSLISFGGKKHVQHVLYEKVLGAHNIIIESPHAGRRRKTTGEHLPFDDPTPPGTTILVDAIDVIVEGFPFT